MFEQCGFSLAVYWKKEKNTAHSESKIRYKEDIDKFVSAELPDPFTDLSLFQILTKCMVRGPCGTTNINSPCMKEGQCYKSFPKQFKDDTEKNVSGYPIYRRKATEPVQVGKYSFDNRRVVPYHPWLLNTTSAELPPYLEAPTAIKFTAQ
ncbi:hypothetical protein AVEN_174311-1 [Araneus ventricosus]|uniref:Uncharacterized protein n=1 Tax=Araneus ventricosus TaxID=182803 RepID=A0A4Y2NYR8_ARAVE|nr:hypothetical protein AVEN_174311-1 [Araneus ventricosus]